MTAYCSPFAILHSALMPVMCVYVGVLRAVSPCLSPGVTHFTALLSQSVRLSVLSLFPSPSTLFSVVHSLLCLLLLTHL